jgi:hypothetical protein
MIPSMLWWHDTKRPIVEHEVPFPICVKHEMKVFMLATRNWLIGHVDLNVINMLVSVTWM